MIRNSFFCYDAHYNLCPVFFYPLDPKFYYSCICYSCTVKTLSVDLLVDLLNR